jgi:hypothetical protein
MPGPPSVPCGDKGYYFIRFMRSIVARLLGKSRWAMPNSRALRRRTRRISPDEYRMPFTPNRDSIRWWCAEGMYYWNDRGDNHRWRVGSVLLRGRWPP